MYIWVYFIYLICYFVSCAKGLNQWENTLIMWHFISLAKTSLIGLKSYKPDPKRFFTHIYQVMVIIVPAKQP